MSKEIPEYLYKVICGGCFLALPLAIFSGFALTPLQIILTLSFATFLIKEKDLKVSKSHILISLFFLMLWALLSTLWSVDTLQSLKYFLRIFLIFISLIIILKASSKIATNHEFVSRISSVLPYAFLAGSIFFIFEIMSESSIKIFIRSIITPDRNNSFDINNFNKSVCFFSLFMWPALCAIFIGSFNLRKKVIFVSMAFFLSSGIIIYLPSMSAILGLIGGFLTFVFVIVTKARFNILIPISIICISILIPFAAYKINPQQLITDYKNIPNSSVHRLFIWNYSADKALEKPILGWGIKSSRSIPGGQDRVTIDGKFYERELLPSHSHNSILQIWLELGVVGILLYLSIIYQIFNRINNDVVNIIPNAIFNALVVNYIIIGMLAFDVWRIWWLSAGIIAIATMVMLSSYTLRKSG